VGAYAARPTICRRPRREYCSLVGYVLARGTLGKDSLRPLVEARTRVSRRRAGSGAVVRAAVGWDVPAGRGPFAFRAFRRRIDDVSGAATRGRSQPFGLWGVGVRLRSAIHRCPCSSQSPPVLHDTSSGAVKSPRAGPSRSEVLLRSQRRVRLRRLSELEGASPAHPIALRRSLARSGWRLCFRGGRTLWWGLTVPRRSRASRSDPRRTLLRLFSLFGPRGPMQASGERSPSECRSRPMGSSTRVVWRSRPSGVQTGSCETLFC
jgi:hypothetical protein